MNKPKFNPDQPFDAVPDQKPKFDPSQPFESKGSNDFSPETALRSYGNAATLGYGDNIRAATEPAVFAMLNAVTGEDVDSDGDYVQRRDEEIKRTKELQKENPWSSRLGTGVGIAATALVPTATLAKGASVGARIANTAINGGIMGAVQNPGEKEGELSGLQLADRAKNAGIGAGTGAVLQTAGEGVAKLASAAPGALKRLAAEKAVKASGAMKRDFERLAESGQLQPLGERLLDDGIVTPLATPKDIAGRLSKKISETSQDLQGQIQKADEVLWRPEGFNMENATPEQISAFKQGFVPTSHVKDQVIQDFKDGFQGVPEEELAPAIAKIEAWFKDRPEHMSVGELQQMKTGLNNFLKKSDFYRDMPGIGKEGLLAVRKGAKDAIETKANAAADILGEQGGGIRATNKKFGQYLEAQDLADDAIGRNASNRMISLTDTIAGAGGAGVAGIPGAVASTLLNKAGRTYANPLISTGANAVGNKAAAFQKFVESSPRLQELFKKSPAAAASMFQSVIARTGQKFQEDPQPHRPQIIDDKMLRMIGDDPNKLNLIKNPRLREQVQRMQVNRFKRNVSTEDAQKQFIEGN